MFTPPPSPLPRGMAGAASMLELPSPDSTQDDNFLLPPPASSPRSPSRASFFSSSPSSSSAPASSSSSPSHHHHDHTPFRHAIDHNDRLKVPLALASPAALLAQRGIVKSSTTAKKAQGRRLRILAFVVPVVLIALTLLSQRLQWRHRTPAAASLWKRAPGPGDDSSSSSGTSTTTDLASLSTSDAAPTPTDTGGMPKAPADDADVPIPTPFPQPFDTSLSSNFTTTACYDFFSTFTQSRAFRSCRSFGLLFANSREFFQATSNLSSMNDIVWGTCHTRTERKTCEDTMTNLATQLKQVACKEDLRAGNALAVAALVGFSNYALYRDAACIVNPRSGAYCYLEALAAAAPSDVYMYSLPLGVNYPAGTQPSCSKCAQAVMSVMRQYAGNATLPVSQTYAEVQNKTEASCGAEYALPAVPTSAAVAGAGARFLGACAAAAAAVSLLLAL